MKHRIFAKIICVILVLMLGCAGVISAAAVGFEDIYKIGDVNLDGEISISDVTDIQRFMAEMLRFDDNQFEKADTNYDNKIDINDATLLQKMIAGLYVPLTCKKGVDISSLNGRVDISKIKDAGYDFVMIRCGFGDDMTSQDDSQFENNVRQCEELGMPWGVYLYSYALTINEAQSEVQHVLRLLKGKKPTMPVVFDMEDGDGYKERYGMPSNATLVNICKTFLEQISDAGYYAVLYTNPSWMNTLLNDDSLLQSWDLWVAQWYTQCDYNGKNLGMWQYGGEVNYIESNEIAGVGIVDKNYVYKDYPLIIKNGGYNGW